MLEGEQTLSPTLTVSVIRERGPLALLIPLAMSLSTVPHPMFVGLRTRIILQLRVAPTGRWFLGLVLLAVLALLVQQVQRDQRDPLGLKVPPFWKDLLIRLGLQVRMVTTI